MDYRQPIYTVNTIRKDKFSSRCVGFFHVLEQAKEVVEQNIGNIYEEGHYPYAVIETVNPGLYPIPLDKPRWRWFYEWVNDGYKECEPFEDDDAVTYGTIG